MTGHNVETGVRTMCPDCRGAGGYYGRARGDDAPPWLICPCVTSRASTTGSANGRNTAIDRPRCPGCGHSCCPRPNLECGGESDAVRACKPRTSTSEGDRG